MKQQLLSYLLLLFLWQACGSPEANNVSEEEIPAESEEAAENSDEEINIPETLSNFNRTFRGNFGDKNIQLNIRRYGQDISGSFWYLDSDEEVFFSGNIDDNSEALSANTFDATGNQTGTLGGTLNKNGLLQGSWINQESTEVIFRLQEAQFGAIGSITVDDISISEKSTDGRRSLKITYPQLLGLKNEAISRKVNNEIERYFESSTLIDSVEAADLDFKEDVTFDITLLQRQFISITKHHHLSRNNDTQIFDDSHGINIDFNQAKTYQIQDLFKPNAIEQLNQLIAERINQSCNGALDAAQIEKCRISAEEQTSFSLSKGKITFHLTERLPYKYRGCGYVRISYNDLAEVINPSGPLSKFHND